VAEAVADVEELTKSSSWSADQWYDFACVYAVASGKATDKKQEYANRAMELLRQSVKAGYADAAHMANDIDLDPLRLAMAQANLRALGLGERTAFIQADLTAPLPFSPAPLPPGGAARTEFANRRSRPMNSVSALSSILIAAGGRRAFSVMDYCPAGARPGVAAAPAGPGGQNFPRCGPVRAERLWTPMWSSFLWVES
jgi:hypothetical protein